MPDSPVPAEVDVLHHLAEHAFALGRPDVAGDLLRQAPRARSPRPDENLDRLHADGLRMLRADQLTEAEPRLLRALQLRPNAADWHEHLAILFVKQRRFAEAANTFRVALRLDPAPASRWNNLSVADREQNNLPAAEAPLREAVRRAPQDHGLRATLIALLNEQKKTEEATAVARQATADFPPRPGHPRRAVHDPAGRRGGEVERAVENRAGFQGGDRVVGQPEAHRRPLAECAAGEVRPARGGSRCDAVRRAEGARP